MRKSRKKREIQVKAEESNKKDKKENKVQNRRRNYKVEERVKRVKIT